MNISETINSDYGNVNNMFNPVLKDILDNLNELGLLDDLEVARNSEEASIKTYKNLVDGKAAALEIIVDCISRGLMKSYRDGFVQGQLSSDGASNVSFKTTPLENLALVGSIEFTTTDNTHQAIYQLAQEIALIKNSVKGLGIVLPPVPPSIPPIGPTKITLK